MDKGGVNATKIIQILKNVQAGLELQDSTQAELEPQGTTQTGLELQDSILARGLYGMTFTPLS